MSLAVFFLYSSSFFALPPPPMFPVIVSFLFLSASSLHGLPSLNFLSCFLLSVLRFGSLEKLCALGGEHPFYMRPTTYTMRVSPLSACDCARGPRACTTTVFPSKTYCSRADTTVHSENVIEDFGLEWECHVDERN